jgi:hypothetical protein
MAIFGTHAADKEVPAPRLSLPAVVTYDGISLLALSVLQAICQTCFQSDSASSALIQLSFELAMLTCTVHFVLLCWCSQVLIVMSGSRGNMEGRWGEMLLLVCNRLNEVVYGACD